MNLSHKVVARPREAQISWPTSISAEVQLHLIHVSWLGVSMYFLGRLIEPSDSKGSWGKSLEMPKENSQSWSGARTSGQKGRAKGAFQDSGSSQWVSMTRNRFQSRFLRLCLERPYGQVTESLVSLVGNRPLLDYRCFCCGNRFWFSFLWTWAFSPCIQTPANTLLFLTHWTYQDRGCQHEWTVKQLQDAVELLEESHLCGSTAISPGPHGPLGPRFSEAKLRPRWTWRIFFWTPCTNPFQRHPFLDRGWGVSPNGVESENAYWKENMKK